MSGLLDAVEAAIMPWALPDSQAKPSARAAVLAVADWLDAGNGGGVEAAAADALREEVAPPKPTAEDVIQSLCAVCRRCAEPCEVCEATVYALRDAGLLKEDTP